MTKKQTTPPVLPAAAVADLLVALGAIARLAAGTTEGPTTRLARIRTVLAAVGIGAGQSPRERVASVKRACSRRTISAAVYPSGVAR